MDRVRAWADKCKQAYKAERERHEAISEEAYRYVRPIEAEIMRRMETAAYERFLEDYGTNAADLWPEHLAVLKLQSPVHQRTLRGLIAQRLERRESPVGMTLGELAQETYENDNRAPGQWHPDRGVQDMHGHEDIVVAEPAPDPAAGSDN